MPCSTLQVTDVMLLLYVRSFVRPSYDFHRNLQIIVSSLASGRAMIVYEILGGSLCACLGL